MESIVKFLPSWLSSSSKIHRVQFTIIQNFHHNPHFLKCLIHCQWTWFYLASFCNFWPYLMWLYNWPSCDQSIKPAPWRSVQNCLSLLKIWLIFQLNCLDLTCCWHLVIPKLVFLAQNQLLVFIKYSLGLEFLQSAIPVSFPTRKFNYMDTLSLHRQLETDYEVPWHFKKNGCKLSQSSSNWWVGCEKYFIRIGVMVFKWKECIGKYKLMSIGDNDNLASITYEQWTERG